MSLAVPSPGFHTWGPAHPRPARPERKRDGQGHRRASGHGRNQIPPCLNLSSCVAWLFPDLPEPQCPRRGGGDNPEPVAGWDDHQGQSQTGPWGSLATRCSRHSILPVEIEEAQRSTEKEGLGRRLELPSYKGQGHSTELRALQSGLRSW